MRAFLKRTPADYFVSPSANCTRVGTDIKHDRFVSLPTPAEHLSQRCHSQCRPSILASLAKQSNKLLQSVIFLVSKCSSVHSSSKTQAKLLPQSAPISTSHNIARVYSARTGLGPERRRDGSFRRFARPGGERYWNGFGFSRDRLDPPHRQKHHVENEHGYPSVLPLPTTRRLIFRHPHRHRHCEGRSL